MLEANNLKNTVFLAATAIIAVMVFAACGGGNGNGGPHGGPNNITSSEEAIELVVNTQEEGDYEYALRLLDRFENLGHISALRANYMRADVYSAKNELRQAEYYMQKAVAIGPATDGDTAPYYLAAASLAGLLVNKGDYDGALRVAQPAAAHMEETADGTLLSRAVLLETIGRCQLNLGLETDAAASYDEALHCYRMMALSDGSADALRHAVINAHNTSLSYLTSHRYAEAEAWTCRADSLAREYRSHPDAIEAFADRVEARLMLHHATAFQGLGRTSEGERFFRMYQETPYGQSDDGCIDGTTYLMAAGRYGEAADKYRDLDRILNSWGMEYNLGNVQRYLFPKYRANVEAGRRDTAIAVGTQILQTLDTAIARASKSDAAQLATIYGMQQKDMEIAHQKNVIASHDAAMERQWWLVIAGVLVLITLFVTIYAMNRRRATLRLFRANEQLRQAYEELEHTTAAKERMESELRIAREIQQSMVPNDFPSYPGLNLYASTTPAKEVGGDLFDFLLEGDTLYFCVGDVSGKGIPASLFMAQTIRLFQTKAKQHYSPATIAEHLNEELTFRNDSGMFVTMFIGRLDMSTGHLEFCNCGHNPPVIVKPSLRDFMDVQPNVPIGLWSDVSFTGEEMDSIKGCSLFVYSDGLTEAENPSQEQFGDEQLLKLLRTISFSDSAQVIDTLMTAVDRHRAGAAPNDDLTMLCLRLD